MFASEHFLRNGTLSLMSRVDGNPRWFTHPAVLTHRALYFFNTMQDCLSNNFSTSIIHFFRDSSHVS